MYFDIGRMVKYVDPHFYLYLTGGVIIIALSLETLDIVWRKCHGSAVKTFTATAFAFCQLIMLLGTRRPLKGVRV